MILTAPNWNVDGCVLWGVLSKYSRSIAGEVIPLRSLDYILGDILSLNFSTSQGGEMRLAKDASWLRVVHNDMSYYDIADCAVDAENDSAYSETTLVLLDRFCSLPEDYMTFENFEWFLAATKTPDPSPQKNIVPRGFWTSEAEDPECISARDDLITSLSAKDGTLFFRTLQEVKAQVDLHCNFEIQGFADLALVSAYLVLKSGRTLKRCAHCGCLFSPSRVGEIYCNRISPEDTAKTCKEAAKYQKQLARERASESGRIYKSINTMLAAKIDYAKTPEDADKRRAELFAFRDKAKWWREEIKRGAAKETDYIAFLNSFKKRKPK